MNTIDVIYSATADLGVPWWGWLGLISMPFAKLLFSTLEQPDEHDNPPIPTPAAATD